MTTDFTLSKTYEPASFEKDIYTRWIESRAFHGVPDARDDRYVIMMPLPNVTGALHMGHAMDNCMQDLLIRWHRMLGDNTLWMPGTDHAGIATQAVVEKRLKELEGLTRHDVGREGLVQRIWAWKETCQTRIIAQQQRMGCSCDWDRYRFTMDKVCARAVRHTFFRLFDDGLVARGKRLVNWDPYLRTSISDDEVYHETVKGHFWHLLYPVIDPQPGEPTHVEVATTRPETMLGDTAVAVHPAPDVFLAEALAQARVATKDEKTRAEAQGRVAALEARIADDLPRLLKLRDMARAGRKVMLPLVDRPIPLICDEWAKPDLGSGCVKITPAHDPNDYDVWKRHRDEIGIVNVLNPDGTVNENGGEYRGLDRFVVRDAVVADLTRLGLLPLIEDREIEIGHSDRSKTPIEPYLSDQWFVRMGDQPGGVEMGRGTPKSHRAAGLVQAAIDAATSGRVKFHPERFVKTYLDWLGEKRDWPISRQLWWGHRIPVWSIEGTVGTVHKLLDKADFQDLMRVHAGAVRVRVAVPDEDRSVRVNPSCVALTRPEHLGDAAATRAFVDVCLLSDDAALVGPLEALGFAQDPDVLDTWFSSAIWPHSTLGWPDPATADPEGGAALAVKGQPSALDYYYPGSCLVTARDIITLWVARMVITGLYNCGDVPFTDVFIHANILDGKGERMSKSKGNGIDPVDIIEEYGTDAMRYVLADMQTGNQDIRLPVTAVCPGCGVHVDLAQAKHGRSIFTYMCTACGAEFDVLGTMPGVPAAKLISERFNDGRKFCNKLWNTARFALGWLEGLPSTPLAPEQLALEDRWILAELNAAVRAVTEGLEAYNPSLALGAARDFMWGSLCDWYLELVKPRLAEGSGEAGGVARRVLAYVLDQTLRLLHPFVPYVSEHLFQCLAEQVPDRSLTGLAPLAPSTLLLAAAWPKPVAAFDDEALCATFRDLQAATSAVREVRATQQVPAARKLVVTVKPPAERAADLAHAVHVVAHLAGASEIRVDAAATLPRGAAQAVVGDLALFVHDVIDPAKERERLSRERDKLAKEVSSAEARLANPSFVDRAPAPVVAEMRERLAGYREQLAAVEGALSAL